MDRPNYTNSMLVRALFRALDDDRTAVEQLVVCLSAMPLPTPTRKSLDSWLDDIINRNMLAAEDRDTARDLMLQALGL